MITTWFDNENLERVAIECELNGVDLSKVQSKVDGKGIDEMTDSEKFTEQKRSVGGSEVGELMLVGFHGFDGRSWVYDRKVAEEPEEISEEKKELFAKGHECEPLIFSLVEKNMPSGWTVRLDKRRYRDVDYDYLHADYDCIIVSPEGEEFVGEMKSYKNTFGRAPLENGVLGEDKGKHLLSSAGYEWQVRYYIREKNCRGAIIFSHPMEEEKENFSIDKLRICIVYRDVEKEGKMMETIHDFWNNNVEKHVRPKFDSFRSKEAFDSALKTEEEQYEEGKECSFSKSSSVWLKQYSQIDEEIKNLQQKIDSAEARQRALTLCLVQSMGDAQIGTYRSDDINYRFIRSIKKGTTTFDKKKLFADHPEINEADYKKVGKETKAFKLESWVKNN